MSEHAVTLRPRGIWHLTDGHQRTYCGRLIGQPDTIDTFERARREFHCKRCFASGQLAGTVPGQMSRAPLVRVYCVGSVKRLGGEDDGCRWAGYRRPARATEAPCPRCGNYVARPGFRSPAPSVSG